MKSISLYVSCEKAIVLPNSTRNIDIPLNNTLQKQFENFCINLWFCSITLRIEINYSYRHMVEMKF